MSLRVVARVFSTNDRRSQKWTMPWSSVIKDSPLVAFDFCVWQWNPWNFNSSRSLFFCIGAVCVIYAVHSILTFYSSHHSQVLHLQKTRWDHLKAASDCGQRRPFFQCNWALISTYLNNSFCSKQNLGKWSLDPWTGPRTIGWLYLQT